MKNDNGWLMAVNKLYHCSSVGLIISTKYHTDPMQNDVANMVALSIFSQIHSLRNLYCLCLRTVVSPYGLLVPPFSDPIPILTVLPSQLNT